MKHGKCHSAFAPTHLPDLTQARILVYQAYKAGLIADRRTKNVILETKKLVNVSFAVYAVHL